MHILDSIEAIDDSMKMLDQLWSLPEQCQRAWEIGMSAPLTGEMEIRQVVVTGLGGSAIGGDLLRVYGSRLIKVPVLVNRDYQVAEFVDEQTLVFAVSYSGNTEETVSAYLSARSKSARIVVLTTGGKLGEMAREDGVPSIAIPAGLAPRSATGYLFIPLLAVLGRMGLLQDISSEIAGLVSHLQSMREALKPQVSFRDNFAKQLALQLHNRIPVIWGVASTTEAVALRWKEQINENSKAPAYCNLFPELNHNEIVGFEVPEELLRHFYIIILRDNADHPRVQKRIELTKGIIGKSVAGIQEVYSSGEGILAKLYSLIYLGDYVSVYLAILYGIDPGPVRVIDKLKAELAGIL